MKTTEQILIIYSVNGTLKEDINKTENTVKLFKREGSTVEVEPLVFQVPDGAAPGATLSSELYGNLIRSIGAIVFVDDMRPNVAYELGFFHGQGRLVLLVTKKNIEDIWLTISDLAGTSLAKIDKYSIEDYVNRYLNRLYDDLALSDLWESTLFPNKNRNLINEFALKIDQSRIVDSDFGKGINIKDWNRLDIDVGKNLLKSSKFVIVLRAKRIGSNYTVYFRIKYSDTSATKKDIWIGLSSVKRMANIQSNERLVPSKNATLDWTIIQGSFSELFRKNFILDKIEIESLNTIGFRAGSKEDQNNSEVEIGYINIIGLE